ncbi:MAG: Smr/MutS family protein [Rhodospirillales bacterium]|nr:Smr/MutS family protein [Rhodospirillales bacterium]
MDDEGDKDLWDLVTRDVKKIAREESLTEEKPKSSQSQRPKTVFVRSEKHEGVPVAYKDKAHAGVGLDRKNAEKLRKGLFPLEGRLDLHGMRRVQARAALEDFIVGAQASGKRCVLVITGKGAGSDGRRDPLTAGDGVLRREVPVWLSEPPLSSLVLKNVPAQPRHGGEGAFYVLLRRER